MLWKDHTAIIEAAEINRLAKNWTTDYTIYEGGIPIVMQTLANLLGMSKISVFRL